jgi:protein gp37
MFLDKKILRQLLTWRKPARVFLENKSDLFGDFVKDELIDEVFDYVGLARQHIIQILTKRPERLAEYAARKPLPKKCWIGVSVENQETADQRIPILLTVNATVRFTSVST